MAAAAVLPGREPGMSPGDPGPRPGRAPARTAAPETGRPPAVTAPSPADERTPSGLRATARIRAAPDGRGGTALPVLSGAGPLALRRTRKQGPRATVTIVGAMSAPLGGDHLTLTAHAAPGAQLTVDSAAATLALPGPDGEPARYDVALSVEHGARMRWLPEPLISVRGSVLRQSIRVSLAPSARLVLRDEQVLGRTGEETGRVTSRITVHRAGRPLLEQQIDYGPGVPGWDSGAVLGEHRAVGQLLVVDPDFDGSPPPPRPLGDGASAAVTPLAGPAVLVTAVAPDALQLRRMLAGAGRFTTW
ncbi:urease accessory protein UreD [Streptomyces ovatisporus]|uniref:Urease accessory protein UreD n=1 Tax=Streptomyces ovatisporus TaxID=1128682 RepID=A0ABV9AB23_9ACTN